MNYLKFFILSVIFSLPSNTSFGQIQTIDTLSLSNYFEELSSNNKFMGSVSLLANDKIIYSKSFGYSDIESKIKANNTTDYKIGSISKLFTSVLILKAIEDKKLNLDTKLSDFYPKIINANKITIKSLLNHSSGIYSITDDEDYLDWNTNKISEQDVLNKIMIHQSLFEPNSKNEYSNSNYILLSFILQKIYKTDYAHILEKNIIKPLKLKNTYFGISKKSKYTTNSYSFENGWVKQNETHYSVPLGAGAIISNSTDLVFFINDLFNLKIINRKSLDTMLTFSNKYGLGIFDMSFENHFGVGHDGAIDGYKSIVSIFPKEKVSYAVVSNALNYNINLISSTILNAIFNHTIEIPSFDEIVFTEKELDKFLGVFSGKGLPFKITISKENLKLVAQATGQASLPLDAIQKNVFTFDKAGIKLTFSENGKKVILTQAGHEIELEKE